MKKRFTEEVETYTVLILQLDEYKGSARNLPNGFEILSFEKHDLVRAQEKRILQELFDDWAIPYCGKLRGWRVDSPVFVVQGNRLVGGVYLCVGNEFDEDSQQGQLHYAFMDPAFRGQGIYSVIFGGAVKCARVWGLRTLYLNSDRYMLPEVYLRWGAKPYKVISKTSRWSQNRILRPVRPYLRALGRQLRLVAQWIKPPCA
ncbi:MAG: hypothetical protein HY868_15925 [Chloroflexi bacterium]|nr:hypothetical protein [Chloroflexota bacterium]